MHERPVESGGLLQGDARIERQFHHCGCAAADQKNHEVPRVRLLQSMDDEMRSLTSSRIRHRMTSLPSSYLAIRRAHLARSNHDCLDRGDCSGQLLECYIRGRHGCLANCDYECMTKVRETIPQIGDAQQSIFAVHRASENLANIDRFESLLKNLAEHCAPRGVDVLLSRKAL